MALPLVAALAALLTVPLAGGHLGELGRRPFRGSWLPATALGLQVLVLGVLEFSEGVEAFLHVLSYVPLVAVMVLNRGMPGLWLLVAGLALNSAAILANGGVMPADEGAMRRAGLEPSEEFANSGVVEDPRLAWLGDVFAIPEAWPLSNVFSVGDVALVLGVAVFGHRQGDSALGRALGGPVDPEPLPEPAP